MPQRDDDEAGPERTCLVTRRKAAPEAMIRFVLSPDGGVIPDIRRKLPGRGVWVANRADHVEKAVRGRLFARGFKAPVQVPATLAADLAVLLEGDALQSLALAKKAGAVTTGFAKVEAALGARQVAALLHATDGGADGVRKLEAAARTCADPGKVPASLKLFTSQQLDLALGRTNVIHAALAVGPAGEAFLSRCRRAIAYRSTTAPPNVDADVIDPHPIDRSQAAD